MTDKTKSIIKKSGIVGVIVCAVTAIIAGATEADVTQASGWGVAIGTIVLLIINKVTS